MDNEAYKIYRREADGERTLVGYAYSPTEAAVIMDAERDKMDDDGAIYAVRDDRDT